MATDIVPELIKEATKNFEKKFNNNKRINEFITKVKKEQATQMDCSIFSGLVGEITSETLKEALDIRKMPNETMYWNIAYRVIHDVMYLAYEKVCSYASVVQDYEMKKKGIGLKSVTPPFPEERVRGIAELLMNRLKEVDNE